MLSQDPPDKKHNEDIETPIHNVLISPTFAAHIPLSFITQSGEIAWALTENCFRSVPARSQRELARAGRLAVGRSVGWLVGRSVGRRSRVTWASFRHHHVCGDVGCSMKSSALAPVTNRSGCVYHSASGCRAVQASVIVLSVVSIKELNWMKHVKRKFMFDVSVCVCVYVRWWVSESFIVGVAYLTSRVYPRWFCLRDQQVTMLNNFIMSSPHWQD